MKLQNMEEEYGLYMWPCSIILAEYVWQQKARFAGANVVEVFAYYPFHLIPSSVRSPES